MPLIRVSYAVAAAGLSYIATFGNGEQKYTCPGSPAWIHHASCQASWTIEGATCEAVGEEVKARVAGENGWFDQHNRGHYTIESQDSGLIHLKRVTSSTPAFTDKFILSLTDGPGGCEVSGCSESQCTSYLDFSTNYCNMRQLLCGSKDGCKVAKNDFVTSESGFGDCSEHDAKKCMVIPADEKTIDQVIQGQNTEAVETLEGHVMENLQDDQATVSKFMEMKPESSVAIKVEHADEEGPSATGEYKHYEG